MSVVDSPKRLYPLALETSLSSSFGGLPAFAGVKLRHPEITDSF